jgi:hypothetical protein
MRDHWKKKISLKMALLIFTAVRISNLIIHRVSGYRSRSPGFDSQHFQLF